MILFGFKLSRYRQWVEVLREERRVLTVKMLVLAIRGLRRRPLLRQAMACRIRTCHRCPLYDRSLRRCRPYSGSPLGCGCYVPFLAATAEHCWGYQMVEPVGSMGW